MGHSIVAECVGGPSCGKRLLVGESMESIVFKSERELTDRRQGILIDTYESRCETKHGDGEDSSIVFLFIHSARQFIEHQACRDDD